MLAKLNGTTDNPLGRIISSDSPEASWLGSLVTVGAIFGSFAFGMAAGKFGRKPVLIFLGFPFIISFLILAFCTNIWFFYFARAFSGFALGGVFTVIPMYSGEIADDSNRGLLGAAMNCFLTLGLLVTVCVGPYVSFMCFHIFLTVFPIIFIILFTLLCPESPYYLIKKDFRKAEESLRKIRGTYDVSKELSEIKENVEKAEGGSIMTIIQEAGLRKAFLIGAGLIFFQQFSGINVVLFYGTNIFQVASPNMDAALGPIIIQLVQFGTSFITPIFSDRSGRKILLVISHISMLTVEIFLGLYFYLRDNGTNVDSISWLPIATLVLYITGYNFGAGPIPWAVMGELFPTNIKDLASAGVSAVCWICGFVITLTFQGVSNNIGMGPTFWIFSGFGVFATVFVITYVIETKGKSLQQIQDELNG
ncbi:hypothetical protein HHI36_008557 [Cryptolaemus montrouzieri]|uniref:Major facilitator superfamily (MFS) profile domain-containing protein n=1 Tax=Cryptolaemus montrouzieri TaxID=559131 RepID=A0ABD2MSU7_9CUCU